MKKLIIFFCFLYFYICSFSIYNDSSGDKQLYTRLKLDKEINYKVFETAIKGYKKVNKKNSKLVIVDYSKPSTKERFYVIDFEKEKVLLKTYVAHAKNSGNNMATSFSNEPESLKSSIGFFLTGNTYYGKNGYSLRLVGLEKGINDQAENRAIVLHRAEYVSEKFVKNAGRLGRSFGCLALPTNISDKNIDQIKGGAVLYVYGNDYLYELKSKLLIE
ncbi:MAG: murein L,D-transpeptidase catalytic domain family protein [Fusobacteriaceae bacterium]